MPQREGHSCPQAPWFHPSARSWPRGHTQQTDPVQEPVGCPRPWARPPLGAGCSSLAVGGPPSADPPFPHLPHVSVTLAQSREGLCQGQARPRTHASTDHGFVSAMLS